MELTLNEFFYSDAPAIVYDQFLEIWELATIRNIKLTEFGWSYEVDFVHRTTLYDLYSPRFVCINFVECPCCGANIPRNLTFYPFAKSHDCSCYERFIQEIDQNLQVIKNLREI